MSIEYIALEGMEEMFSVFLGMLIFENEGIAGPWAAELLEAPEAVSDLISTLESLPLPNSQRLGTSEGTDGGLECGICFNNKINTRFKECTHGACAACVLGIWKSKVGMHNPLPSRFPCHLCRTEVNHLGALDRDCGGGGGGGVSLDPEWVGIKDWVKGLSEEWGGYVSRADELLGNTQQGMEGSNEV
ncbi:hypothetical protein HOY80DRAFT_1056498 [Tuber brumale]|nr:hypothetical protein HOY80DRAFT_1056498 [Tuber brumale]